MSDNLRILLVNNDGSGFADYTEVRPGTTAGELFRAQMRDHNADDFLIRVNRERVASGYELQQGDRVTITPTKIEGATL